MSGTNEITVLDIAVCARCSLTIDDKAQPCAAAPAWPTVRCTPATNRADEITVDVCESCAVVVFNGDTTHLDAWPTDYVEAIEATIETMSKPALGGYSSDGYVRCYVCGDDVIGSHQVTCEVIR